LAQHTKGYIKVAYWDTEHSGRPPRLLGEYQGTPTIRLFVPQPKQSSPDSYVKKKVMDYQYERKAIDLKKFAESHMPNFLESVRGSADLVKFRTKANQYSLPQVLIFTSKAQTLPLTKFLSTEFRRRLLMAEIHPTKLNQAVITELNITKFPTILVYPPVVDGSSAETAPPIRYDGDKSSFTRHKLHSFLSKYALKEKVLPPPKTAKRGDDDPAAASGRRAATTDSTTTTSQQQQPGPVRVGADGEL
jgi:hypothetical protein